jgi:hypothetical protein
LCTSQENVYHSEIGALINSKIGFNFAWFWSINDEIWLFDENAFRIWQILLTCFHEKCLLFWFNQFQKQSWSSTPVVTDNPLVLEEGKTVSQNPNEEKSQTLFVKLFTWRYFYDRWMWKRFFVCLILLIFWVKGKLLSLLR